MIDNTFLYIGIGIVVVSVVISAVVRMVLLPKILPRMKNAYGVGADRDRLLSTGIPGQAVVLAAQQTGTMLNNQPQVIMTLRVTTATHGTYQASTTQIVPLIRIGALSSGQPIPVMVDPADPQKIAINWQAGSAMGIDL